MKIKVLGFFQENKWLFGLNILGLYLFVKMAEDVIQEEYILVIDRWISIHINTVQTPLVSQLMVFLTDMNSAQGTLFVSFVLMLWLLYKKYFHDLWFYFLCVGGAAIAFSLVKIIVQRMRPVSDIISVTGYSFPSGHATMATAVALSVYIIFAKRVHLVGLRILLLFVCIAWALIIAFSRIYLDVHWMSDVIAGLGLGLFWVTLIVLCKNMLVYIELINLR